MRSYEESSKSKKTVASMIEKKGEVKDNKKQGIFGEPTDVKICHFTIFFLFCLFIAKPKESPKSAPEPPSSPKTNKIANGEEIDEEILQANRLKFAQKLTSGGKKSKDKTKSPKPTKEGKKPRVWDLGGNAKDIGDLDRTKDKPTDDLRFNPDTAVSYISFISLHIKTNKNEKNFIFCKKISFCFRWLEKWLVRLEISKWKRTVLMKRKKMKLHLFKTPQNLAVSFPCSKVWWEARH